MATYQTNTNTLYTISAIFSAIAALLLTFTDFGGLYYYEYYSMGSYFEMWVYIFLFSNVIYTILILPVIGGFLYTIYLVQEPIRNNTELNQEKIDLLWKIGIGTLSVIIFGLIIFIIETFEATEWWLDAAFFGSIIGAGANVYVFNILRSKPTSGDASVATNQQSQAQTNYCKNCGNTIGSEKFCKKCGEKV